MGCGGPLSLTDAGCRPDVLGRRGDTSGVSCASARAPAPGSLPPRGGVTCKNWTFTWGAGPCGGSRAPGPPVIFSRRGRSSWSSLNTAHTGNLGAWVASVGPPRGAVQPFPVTFPGGPVEACKFRVGFWVPPLPRSWRALYGSTLSMTESRVLDSGRG